MTLPLKHRGARAELIACQWLLERGYEVFRNISASGIADLVAFRDSEILKIDVKSESHGKHRVRLPLEQVNAGIVPLYVFPDGACELDLAPGAGVVACPGCGKSFRPRHKGHKYCELQCEFRKRDGQSEAA